MVTITIDNGTEKKVIRLKGKGDLLTITGITFQAADDEPVDGVDTLETMDNLILTVMKAVK